MSVRRVMPKEAESLLAEGYVYVDVRSVPEFEESHPAGAYNAPLMHAGPGGMTPNPEFLAAMQRAFPVDARLLLGCRSGARSLRAAEALAAAGYTDLVDLQTGFDGNRDGFGRVVAAGWRDAGLPVESGPGARGWATLSGK
ncbi:MAG: rhodanese-like domain-containing protein [Polyangiaceae bacterium]|nr:rhodanese-like domain-containing protein [Polyangiaceae bacterium]